jgi:small subunit ribosomal protein S16
MGRTRKPFYRVVASDVRAPRDGRFIEVLGTYNPNTQPAQLNLKMDRINHWKAQGAQPSDTVARLINMVEAETAN